MYSNMHLPVMETACAELFNWHNSGLGVMELSHRSKEYLEINQKSNDSLHQLLNIPMNYKILFMQGGATLQAAAVPMNLLQDKTTANYLVNGHYGQFSYQESLKYCQSNLVAPLQESYDSIPQIKNVDPQGAYFMYTDDEPENGLAFHSIPQVDMTLVSDMSGSLGSKNVDISKFGCIYASVQNNLGTSGHCIVIIREDLLGKQQKYTPSMFDWKKTNDANSIFNTPPCYAIYFTGLCVDYMIQNGGLNYYQDLGEKRSKLIYDVIDGSHGFYSGVKQQDRSNNNIVFNTKQKNIQLIEQFGLNYVSLGKYGVKVSLQNGMTIEGTKQIRDLMIEFQDKNQ